MPVRGVDRAQCGYPASLLIVLGGVELFALRARIEVCARRRMGMFVRMLEGKAARYGRTFGKVDRWFPSTRMRSVCGAVGDKKPLYVRMWTCTCGAIHDRDVNAARNILAAGRAEGHNACGGTVSLSA